MDTDGDGRSLRLWGSGLEEERLGETGLLLPRQIHNIFLIFSSADLAWFTKPRFFFCLFLRFSRVPGIFRPIFPIY